MESEILKVQLIPPPVYQYIIQFLVTFIPSILVGIAVGLGLYYFLRKSRRKEAADFEKKKKEFETKLEIVRKFRDYFEKLFEAIDMGQRKLLFNELKDVDIAKLIRERHLELKRYYETNIKLLTPELSEKFVMLNRPVYEGFIYRLKEKIEGKKDFEFKEVGIDYVSFINLKEEFLNALYKQAVQVFS
jgi:hypothetical protein